MSTISDERLAEIVGFHKTVPFRSEHDDELVAALTELQSLRAQGGVRVKPLEWGERRAIHEVNWAWDAKTSIDWYVVATASGEGCKGTFYWFVAGDTVKGWANSEEEAKAAAQADYERRVLSSLEASPAPVSGEMTLEQKLKAFISWTKKHPANWDVGAVRVNGVFQRFMDPETDTAWMGFEAALAAKGGQ